MQRNKCIISLLIAFILPRDKRYAVNDLYFVKNNIIKVNVFVKILAAILDIFSLVCTDRNYESEQSSKNVHGIV